MADRKTRTKRFNERVKLMATTANALGIGVAGSALIIPATRADAFAFSFGTVIWLLAAIALHLVGHLLIGLIRSED